MVSETKTTEAPTLRRELKARHLTMIAIGGSIGTGLFVASGATISAAGPGGALFSYILIGLMVYFLMTSLGELAAYMPVSGSFSTYGQNYVEEGFGFALGWNYWYNWAVTIAVDLGGRTTGDELVVPGHAGLDLERTVPRRYLPAELHFRSRIW